eukprot:5032881-Alexandrium_andersonii.AAC.1
MSPWVGARRLALRSWARHRTRSCHCRQRSVALLNHAPLLCARAGGGADFSSASNLEPQRQSPG